MLFTAGALARIYAWYQLVAPFSEADEFGIYWYKWIYYPTYCRLDGLLMGVSIAALFQFRPALKARIQQYGNPLLFLSLVILIAAYFVCLEPETFAASVFGFPLVSLGYGLMVLAAISPACFLYRFNSNITVRIATLSYAIYLTHKITIHITQEQFSKFYIDKDSNLMFFICIITSLLGAILLNKIIEKPFLQLRDKVLQKGRTLHWEKIPVARKF